MPAEAERHKEEDDLTRLEKVARANLKEFLDEAPMAIFDPIFAPKIEDRWVLGSSEPKIEEPPPFFEEDPPDLRRTPHLRSSAPKNEEPPHLRFSEPYLGAPSL